MNPKRSDSAPGPTCWDCGASNDPGASECWLCHRRDWRHASGATVPAKPESETAGVPGASGMVGVVLLLVGFGVLAAAPGFVLLVAVLILPAWLLGMFLTGRLRPRKPSAMSTARTVLLVVLVPFLVGLAVFIALGMLCFLTVSPDFH